MRITFLVMLLLPVVVNPASADGERDNHPDNVRRIPRAGVPVPPERRKALQARLSHLQEAIADLRKSKDPATRLLLPDVQIFERAVRCALDYNEFFSPRDIDKADALLAEGLSRADQLKAGKAEWPQQSGLIVRGYVSRIDHTVQPYGLVVPPTYTFRHSVPTRCDIWFHGRGETLSEVNFIWDRMKNKGRYTPDHTIVLHPYGRYSNAFKFAGEVDVLESLEDVQHRYRIDEDRISVRGFSMGGAACWQFAVHYADRWFAANPGAGFSETPEFLKFFQKETLNPTPWETALWRLYDCNRYAINLAQCPTIAYSGENDIQKQAADVMEAALKERRIRLRHVIGAGMGHTIDDGSKQVIEAAMTSLAKKGRRSVPRFVQFETNTLKYNRMNWLTINRVEQHWTTTSVFAELSDGIVLRKGSDAGTSGRLPGIQAIVIGPTDISFRFSAGEWPFERNGLGGRVDTLRLQILDMTHTEDGELSELTVPGCLSDGSLDIRIQKTENGWTTDGVKQSPGLQKTHNLQGPIDDAFMDTFVFVRPTGMAANKSAGNWAAAELERAIEHWRRHFRGDARVVDDNDVTDELIQSANLVLWGDPSSNSIMQKVADELPVKWTKRQVSVAGRDFDSTHHVPILIYPNPLNPDRYVVLNSSFTFRDYAYLNNARQVPMLPDWAVVDLNTPPGNVWPGKVVAADFFDEQWQVKP